MTLHNKATECRAILKEEILVELNNNPPELGCCKRQSLNASTARPALLALATNA